LNGLTKVAITKLDVLSGIERIGVVTDYRLRGESVDFGAAGAPGLEVVVEEMEGWSEPIDQVRRIADLPKAARQYVARLEELLRSPVEIVSVGRERSQLAV
jgi:adenylosuccinate synthase